VSGAGTGAGTGTGTGAGVYETDALLREYLDLHYAPPLEALPYPGGPADALEFPARCAALAIEEAARPGVSSGRALEVGCAVGRASFELARAFGEVVGVDLSASFIGAARALAREGRLAYARRIEGEIDAPAAARVDPAIDRGRVRFETGDACALPPSLAGFDVVLAANLICRLPRPAAFLARLHEGEAALVRPGGLLVLTSPYTWLAPFTPREAWLGGRVEDGAPVRSRDALARALAPAFDLLRSEDMPLLIREHARKFQLVVSHATVWRRRGAPA
jgi:putative 4-mercaptohistidine N1-methyltranferase